MNTIAMLIQKLRVILSKPIPKKLRKNIREDMKNDNFTELLSCSYAVKLFFCLFCWIAQKPIGLAGKL